jgi:hypothetical protein
VFPHRYGTDGGNRAYLKEQRILRKVLRCSLHPNRPLRPCAESAFRIHDVPGFQEQHLIRQVFVFWLRGFFVDAALDYSAPFSVFVTS